MDRMEFMGGGLIGGGWVRSRAFGVALRWVILARSRFLRVLLDSEVAWLGVQFS